MNNKVKIERKTKMNSICLSPDPAAAKLPVLGLDVAKKAVQAELRTSARKVRFGFANSAKGFAQLAQIRWQTQNEHPLRRHAQAHPHRLRRAQTSKALQPFTRMTRQLPCTSRSYLQLPPPRAAAENSSQNSAGDLPANRAARGTHRTFYHRSRQ